jgi:hypothetical protein
MFLCNFETYPFTIKVNSTMSTQPGEYKITLKNNLKRIVRSFRTGVTKSLPEILSLIPFFELVRALIIAFFSEVE